MYFMGESPYVTLNGREGMLVSVRKPYLIVTEIAELVKRGLTDHQIGALMGKHYKTIYHHRMQNGIPSGRSHKVKLSQERRGIRQS
jgi:hypothetical protein